MKKIVLVLFVSLLAITSIHSQEKDIKWITLEEAVEAQKKNPKKIIIDAYTVWCGPCKMLENKTFRNPDVVEYINDNFYAVKFNAEGDDVVNFKGKQFINPQYDSEKKNKRNSTHQLTMALGVQAFPTIVYLDENSDLIAAVPGYVSPRQLEVYLTMFNTNAYKTFVSKDDADEYYSNYVHTFRD